jgi:phosphoglycolate phosphatase
MRNRVEGNRSRTFSTTTILFDLDGTLTDSKPGITRCVQHALAGLGIVVDDIETLSPFVGPPLRESFHHFYGFDDAQTRRAVAIYRERYTTVGMFENEVYAGIPELLNRLRAAGATLAVASSKPTVYVEQILEHFALANHFTAVAGSNLDGTRIAKDEVIAHALSLLPMASRDGVVMVGDREHDVFGARAHGIETIAAGYGYSTPGELAAASPLAIVNSVAELAHMLLTSR